MKFLVIGDSCTDKFIYGKSERICPEAPVPVFTPMGGTTNGGMAKNVQSNVIALGVECDIETNKNDIEKKRYVDLASNQMLLRVDVEDRATDFFNRNKVEWGKYDAVLVSDYDKGFLSDTDINKICLEHDNVFLNTKRVMSYDIPRNIRFVQMNEHELNNNRCLGLNVQGKEDHYVKDKVIVTLGSKGCLYKNKIYRSPRKRDVRDLSGAGDTFLAAFSVSMMRDNNIEMAINFAQKCASIVVGKKGVATV